MKNTKHQFNNFFTYPHTAQGISTKLDGSMKNVEDRQIDRDALTTFAQTVGIMDPIVCMQQVHSGTVAVIENAEKLRIPETDGLITNKKNIPLAVLTADCLPITLYDPKNEVIGIAHAGYRGLLHHIVENTVEIFTSKFDSNPKDIIVGIGPCIETMCYEVGKEVIEQFEEAFPKFQKIYIKKDGKFYLDLRSVALQCLMNEGILKEHIEVMNICTKSDDHFYSYRGGDGDKRFASVISLV